mgnify:CR=1 FL=1
MATYRVSTQSQLDATLPNLRGGDTLLLSGRFSDLTMTTGWKRDFKFSQKVTIASENPNNPAVINQMYLRDVANLEIRDVTLDYIGSLKSGSPSFMRGKPFFVEKATNVTIDSVTVDGHLRKGLGVDNGINFKQSNNLTIHNSNFKNFYVGILGQNSQDVVLSGNKITGMSMDGIQVGGMTRMIIEGNEISNFKSATLTGLHRDNIQFRTLPSEGPSRDIVIRDNAFDSAEGRHVIFFGNELYRDGDNSAFHKNILIEDNYIRAAHVFGVAVWHADGLTIRENTLVNNPDLGLTASRHVPILNVSMLSKNVKILDNVVASVPVPQNSTWTVSGNKTDGKTYFHHYNPTSMSSDGAVRSVAESPSGPTTKPAPGTSATEPTDVRVVDSRLESGVDVFRIKKPNVDRDVRFVVEGLDFGEGDALVLRDFHRDTFQDKWGGNPVNTFVNRTSVRIDDAMDIQELAAFSPRVTASVNADDAVVLAVTHNRGVAEIVIEGLGTDFRAADQPDLF